MADEEFEAWKLDLGSEAREGLMDDIYPVPPLKHELGYHVP